MKRTTIVSVIDTISTIGLFIILFFVIRTYVQTINILTEIRGNQESNQQASETRDEVILSYLKCKDPVEIKDRTQALLQKCQTDAKFNNDKTPQSTSTPNTTSSTTPNTESKQTSKPVSSNDVPAEKSDPEPQKSGIIERINTTIENILRIGGSCEITVKT